MESATATGTADLRTIETDIPARLDRLPWSRFHWLIVIGLGTVWILDGLEVTIVGSIASRLTEKGSGITIDAGQIGTAAAFYVAGACLGALFFGQLTDRFGRRKLFLMTLLVYIAATVATGFAFAPWYLYMMRFFTGAGIGGEYAAINSAIDELIPARVRGRVDLIINGSFWAGAAAGALLSILLLDTSIFAKDFGWRLSFGLGTLLSTFFGVAAGSVPIFFAIFAFGNFLGPLTLGRLFDTVGRRPMITITYLGSAIALFVLALLLTGDTLTKWSFLAFIVGIFFIASAGASSAYLTVSEIFPMETRALAIAFFYAIGTAIGGITGPLLFGHLIKSGDTGQLQLAFLIGAGVMAIGGIAELFLGVRAERRSLEEIATPLTAEEVEEPEREISREAAPEEVEAARARARAAEERERAADLEKLAHAVEERAGAAEQRAQAEEIREEKPAEAKELREEAAERDRRAREQEERIRQRIERRRQRERTGIRRYRPGYGSVSGSPGYRVSEPVDTDEDLGREIGIISRALDENGPANRQTLERLVGGRYWGPGRFRTALREAVGDGDIRRTGRDTFAPGENGAAPDAREPAGSGSSRS